MATTNIKNNFNIKDHNGSTKGLYLNGTLVTATAAELNNVASNTGRVVAVTTTPLAVTLALHDKKMVVLDRAAGITATLPAAAGTGAEYKFFVKTSASGGSYIIKVANASDIMTGHSVIAQDSADTVVQFDCAADSDTITLNGTTTGGLKGDMVTIRDIATNLFHVTIESSATGVEATPFSATV